MSVDLAGLELKNPIILSSGTAGYCVDLEGFIDPKIFGAVVLKSVTLESRKGNPGPRIWETPCGVLNSIGLENIGARELTVSVLPKLADAGTGIVVSVAGETMSEYAEVMEMVGDVEAVDAFELNVSCPNVERGGIQFCLDEDAVGMIVEKVRKRTDKPLFVKLSFAGDTIGLSRTAVEAGADGLSLINSLPGMVIDLDTMRPGLGAKTGGLSGPAIKPVALHAVWECAEAVGVPLIGGGGVYRAEDAMEFILAGATAVSVGTAVMSDAERPRSVVEGLSRVLGAGGFEGVRDAVGFAHR